MRVRRGERGARGRDRAEGETRPPLPVPQPARPPALLRRPGRCSTTAPPRHSAHVHAGSGSSRRPRAQDGTETGARRPSASKCHISLGWGARGGPPRLALSDVAVSPRVHIYLTGRMHCRAVSHMVYVRAYAARLAVCSRRPESEDRIWWGKRPGRSGNTEWPAASATRGADLHIRLKLLLRVHGVSAREVQ